MNEEADYYVTTGQKHFTSLPNAPTPTFMMDAHTLYREGEGWIESNTRAYVERTLIYSTSNNLSIGHRHRMTTWLYDKTTIPEYPYKRAYSSYSATVQLYARSGQLATADLVAKRDPNSATPDLCRFGCGIAETAHHLFSTCTHFVDWLNQAKSKVVESTTTWLKDNAELSDGSQRLIEIAEKLFEDHEDIWPLGRIQYYLGYTPQIRHIPPQPNEAQTPEWKRILSHLSRDWHLAGIYLAGRIYGALQRKAAEDRDIFTRSGN
jgi:hypothetical protein